MKPKVKLPMLFVLALLIILVITSQGCGHKETAPDGSTVTFNPSSITYKTPDNVCVQSINVIVRYPDGTPFPKAVVTITGGFAVPNVNGSGYYQFFSDANCSNPVDSGFQAQTDDKGVYSFSAYVPGQITLTTGITTTNSFSDKFEATSGTAVGSADFKFN